MASTVEHSTRKNQSKSNNLSVTGNTELDNWIRVIEYIAKFKNELWMLHGNFKKKNCNFFEYSFEILRFIMNIVDVFEMGPKQLPENLGEQTNEMVAFRCLASLFDSSTSKDDVVSDAELRIEFDTSQSCEHVLQCILDEVTKPNIVL